MPGGPNARTWATWLLVAAGVVLVAIAIVYFVAPAKSLPTFFPGHTRGLARHHDIRAIAALVVGVLAFGAALIVGTRRAGASGRP